MLTCSDFLSEFGNYLDNSVSPEVRTRLEAHLRECKHCTVLVDSTRKTIQFVTDDDLFTVEVQDVEPVITNVMDRVRARMEQKKKKQP